MPPAICCFTLLPYINISRLLRCQTSFFSYSCPRNAKAHQHSAQWRSAHRVYEGKAKLVAFYVLCICVCVYVFVHAARQLPRISFKNKTQLMKSSHLAKLPARFHHSPSPASTSLLLLLLPLLHSNLSPVLPSCDPACTLTLNNTCCDMLWELWQLLNLADNLALMFGKNFNSN